MHGGLRSARSRPHLRRPALAFQPTKITSSANPQVKLLKSLHAKKGRQETGLFLAEGARLAIEAAELGRTPDMLALAPAAMARPQVQALARRVQADGGRVFEASEAVLAQITRKDNPQTVIGAYRQHLTPIEALPAGARPFFIALEGVRDPGNLGTIIRTADGVGADGVLLIGQTCDPFSVEAVRATMGSIFALPVVRAEPGAFFAWAAARGLRVLGASLKGRRYLEGQDLAAGVVLLMGNEQSGLPEDMESAADALIRLPMKGRADSLNLAIATGVIAYDIWRGRGYDGARD